MTREIEDTAAGAIRIVRALGRRIGAENPEDLRHLMAIEEELGQAYFTAVRGLRDQGMTWDHIGKAMGVTRQAAQQRHDP